ncbi:hypothetical protein FKP32DRAFT_1614341 [Trametes sanguinea]|nr:hypothetical protein FKP32DRAFT_1614341 [Trametes sanguinea]
MSFVAVDEARLARDLWPEGIGRPSKDTDDIATLPASRVVPADYKALCQWLCVDSVDATRPATVFVNPDVCSEGDTLHEVTLRLQGVVVDVNLNALGNWTGDVDYAPKAVQSLRLGSGGYAAAFVPQVQALRNIRELVLKLMSKPMVGGEGGGVADILLKRRVFEKVRGGTCGPSVLNRQDDPTGRAAKMSHMWRVTHRITVGVQNDDGHIVRASPLVIRRGDFVDVAVTIQVYTMRAHRQRKTEVQFCPVEVVRLKTAQELKVGHLR